MRETPPGSLDALLEKQDELSPKELAMKLAGIADFRRSEKDRKVYLDEFGELHSAYSEPDHSDDHDDDIYFDEEDSEPKVEEVRGVTLESCIKKVRPKELS